MSNKCWNKFVDLEEEELERKRIAQTERIKIYSVSLRLMKHKHVTCLYIKFLN